MIRQLLQKQSHHITRCKRAGLKEDKPDEHHRVKLLDRALESILIMAGLCVLEFNDEMKTKFLYTGQVGTISYID